MKIKNLSRFITSILVILFILGGISLFISQATFSYGEVSYKTIYVSYGDTLWSIAENEKENNNYYKEYDIRDIISQIKRLNYLGTTLYEGQKLEIPYI